MSIFTADDVRRLAVLAQLQLAPEEIDVFVRQLSEILDFARQVQSVDTSTINVPEGFLLSAAPPVRDDVRQPSLPRDEVLAAAPQADGATGLFKVPRVLT